MTAGSVGAAGYKWPMICQPCKDIEDGALAASLTTQARNIDRVCDALNLSTSPIQEMETTA